MSVCMYGSQTFPIKLNAHFQSSGRVHTYYLWMHHIDADKAYREKAWQQLQWNVMSHTEKILEATSHKAAVEPISYF